MPAVSSRMAVIGTAGHIDHGKTALVRRLTGIDTDRLPEEKRRGISIDLGFARLVTPAGAQAGIVDVPGHERFVKNMLAGVGGIDLVLLVIAADEGPMPQTREHLAIVRLLGVTRGVVVLTKADLVEPEWMEMVRRDVRALLEGTPFATSPVVEFSAVTGKGTDELLRAIDDELAGVSARDVTGGARLPVDRVFTAEGFGTVVTGTLWRGTVRAGDTLALLPRAVEVRVRRVQVHGATVESAVAGQRTALALHGVERAEVARGDWLVAPQSLTPARMIDVRFELLPDVPRAWPVQARVRFHLGASEIIGRLVLLEGESLAPGASTFAQVRLERPAVVARGDRFVIRTYSPACTVGGGSVIQPAERKRRRHDQLDAIALMEQGSLEQRARQAIEGWSAPEGEQALARALSCDPSEARDVLQRLAAGGTIERIGRDRWIGRRRLEEAMAAFVAEATAYAHRYPARFGIAKGELKAKLLPALGPDLAEKALTGLLERGALVPRAERLRPGASPWAVPAETMRVLDQARRALEEAGLAPPETARLQATLGPAGAEALALGVFLGQLVPVGQEFTFARDRLDALRKALSRHFSKRPTLDVATFKELTGVSRKFAVPLLEFSDRSGWTRRVGDERHPGPRLERALPEAHTA